MNMNRRRFLHQAAGAALGPAAVGAIGLAADAQHSKEHTMPESLPIVDTHQHLWDLSKLRLSWLKGRDALNRNHVMKDYLEATAGLNVVKAVYMEVDVDAEDKVAEAEYLIDICRRGDAPTCAAVIGGRPGEPGFREYITRYKGNPYIKGVREVLFKWKEGSAFFLDKAYVDSVRLLGELGMSFDICVAAAGLADAAKLVDLCPNTRFILDHCGNADVKQFYPADKYPNAEKALEAGGFVGRWRRDIAALASRKSVICKISGIVASVPKQWVPDDLAPIINHCLDSFGPDRVVFGGDWPVCTKGATYRQWVEALRQVIRNRSEAEQRRLLSENAIRFYGLT
jgi:predicted TIM-barrel fold metal-dependent hydrolase